MPFGVNADGFRIESVKYFVSEDLFGHPALKLNSKSVQRGLPVSKSAPHRCANGIVHFLDIAIVIMVAAIFELRAARSTALNSKIGSSFVATAIDCG
jgi:hypothetical protein